MNETSSSTAVSLLLNFLATYPFAFFIPISPDCLGGSWTAHAHKGDQTENH